MTNTDRERAPIMLRRVRSGLTPVTAFDAEMLDSISMGSDVEVRIKQRRSLPQLRLYWSVLHKVIGATDAYPTAERLHDALKMATGHTVPVRRLDGTLVHIPDSVAFSKMSQGEFQVYFNKAMQLLTELIGVDPLEWLMTQDDLKGVLQASLQRGAAA